MPRVIAADFEGEVSQNGTLTNPIFESAAVGDVAVVSIKLDTVGYEYQNFSPTCSAEVEQSLDGETYSASPNMGTITSNGTDLYLRCIAPTNGVVSLTLPQSGIAAVSGVVGVSVGAPLNGSFTIPEPTLTIDQIVSVDALTSVFSLPTPSFDDTIIVNADVLTAATSLPTTTIIANTIISADVLTATTSVQAPSVTAAAPSGLANGTYYLRANGSMTTQAPPSSEIVIGTQVPNEVVYAGYGPPPEGSGGVLIPPSTLTSLGASAQTLTVMYLDFSNTGSARKTFTFPSDLPAGKVVRVFAVTYTDGEFYTDVLGGTYITVADS